MEMKEAKISFELMDFALEHPGDGYYVACYTSIGWLLTFFSFHSYTPFSVIATLFMNFPFLT
jgi:hypothetical protein